MKAEGERTLTVELGDRSYPIYIGSGLLDHSELYRRHIPARQVMVVTNETVAPLYLEPVLQALQGLQTASVVLPDGEQHKTLSVWNGIFDELLKRRFNVGTAPAAWAGDITYIRTAEGWLYLAVLLSVNTRRVVGHATGRLIDTNLCLAALEMATGRVAVPAGTLHHTDRGKQYCSAAYRRQLGRHGLRPSMSRSGDPWDNAVVESFFSTLKRELIHRRSYHTRDQARRDIFEYIEVFYNRQRRHTALEYLTPEEYAKINNLP